MKVVTIGRSTQNDVVINDPYVGRNHLQIIQKNDGCFYVADFGSKNGTYINGRKVQGEVRLSSTDVVRIGNTTLPWKSYFPTANLPQETEYQGYVETDWPSEETKPKKKRKRRNDSDIDWHEVNELKIDYNEGGFGRKFGQAAGDVSGNIVGCFIGIVIVVVLMILIGLIVH